MNCKPGDLAVLVGAYGSGKLIGHIFKCAFWYTDFDGEPRWVLDKNTVPSGVAPECDDKFLRPIRDQDGEDETLTWAGKPSEIKEAA